MYFRYQCSNGFNFLNSGVCYSIVVALVVTYTLVYIYKCNAPNLGQPLRWDCSSNNLQLNQINQTKVFLGIFSTRDKLMRREMIRETYLQHRPDNMEYKFIIVAQDTLELQEEISTYDDILLVKMEKENMNAGKTYEFFKMMAGLKRYSDFDFVLKADDDAYLHLDRIQFDLAHTNRNMSYWGYLVGNTFMAGQCYGLSMDLVKWVANSTLTQKYKAGHEDSQVQKWFLWSNINDQIRYEVRNCRIHDHINSGSVYAKDIDINSSMVVHHLKKDHFFMRTHFDLSPTYR
ncbi:uncharacterized protein EV154DRAFT_576406 [Mucor mucedo]|uniref:uncharacterized protein n=1 Tax=Mucor mucedo TaxID=29922 RepID=UPI00221FD5E8|nr:uncharacterized protein EV154DRAFT_576406 [Mucor mucedo]KAI7878728.1 hypothetical protein EV154DRAFT_576406 [Mucor mucedo]